MEFKFIPTPTNQTHKRIPNPPKSKSLHEIQFIPFLQTKRTLWVFWFLFM